MLPRKISDLLGVEWAPLDIPMSRRLQTLGATAWICLALFGEALAIYLFIKLVYSDYWWLAILYGYWMLNDIEICNKGGRTFEFARNWSWWRYFCDYFPITLVKTADLDPSKNYLFACYPHGIFSSGAYGSFATNGANFPKLFPGMSAHLIVLGGHFLVPFFRDLILALGLCSSSQESILYLLDPKRYQGNCVAIMVGGAAEALDSHPGKYKIILSRRKGFIRVAMKSGASLVPVFSFGETDVFRPIDNPENGILRRIQEKVRVWTGISPMFPLGRGVFQYSFGVVPIRTPVTTVVGEPMEVKKNLEPTSEEIDAVHAEFSKRLTELFEREKSKYLKNHEGIHLVIT
ncbi:2-acylglycerol O-acyltransferase 1 isoform X2 [Manduca sexta]|uniref:Acyltransferase n=1 Tax=Manduca sexta TaxID=7130 RepID=A0A023J967_MANSE|nr:2-acylglycerol O-acyltransferase 1 isoform X2 [Manduca sexta]AHH25135.1 monoacylglycerol acyl transferase [Manduca sexta]KAG6453596.1 hypothetical protein O3G_MSEX008236 [Manduca sexta]